MDALNKRIKYFLEVASCLNFSAAAENLFLSQQAVTYQIAELEKELGVKLLVRTTRSVQLTEAGMYFRDEFVRINRDAESVIEVVRNNNTEDQTHITVGLFASFSRSNIIVPIMRTLHDEYPGIVFIVKLYSFSELRNHMQDGELDVCVATCLDWKNWNGVKGHVLQTAPLQLVYSKDHPLAKISNPGASDLSKYDLFKFPSDTALGWSNKGSRIAHNHAVDVPDMGTLLVYLEGGAGFSVLTDLFEGADSGKFVFSPLKDDEIVTETVVAYREDVKSKLTLSIVQTIREVWNGIEKKRWKAENEGK